MKKILEVKNLTTSYNNHIAIENISFSILEGEYVCFVGENGTGKSTLIKTIMGMQKKDSGEIHIYLEKKDISYLAQNNMKNITFPATAKEIILTGRQEHKKIPFYTKEDYQKFKEICKTLKIEDIIHKRIGDLSGGQRQRVLLARSLIKEPKLLILDEPCSGLDSKITKELYEILQQLNKEKQMTILMATHDIDEIKKENLRIIHLAGKIKFDGKVQNWRGL